MNESVLNLLVESYKVNGVEKKDQVILFTKVYNELSLMLDITLGKPKRGFIIYINKKAYKMVKKCNKLYFKEVN